MVELVALCSSGLEGAVCIELRRLGFKIQKVTAGHIHFNGQLWDVPLLNSSLNSADRIMIHMKTFEATTFDELYEGTKSADWQEAVHRNGSILVEKVKVRNSKLSATGAIASVVKKAIYDSIKSTKETDGIEYPIYIYIKNDIVTLMLDTTGKEGLSKRGYRIKTSKAPLRETIAAALILMSDWDEKTLLVDPFCGSGTIPIEAARIAMRIPNLRKFSFERWQIFQNIQKQVITHKEVQSSTLSMGFDKDCEVLKVAIENARRARVSDKVIFRCKSFDKLNPFTPGQAHVVTNPPFGMRMKEGDSHFYRDLSKLFYLFEDCRICLITPKENFEEIVKIRATKKFKFQNSGIWTWCYIF